MWRLVSRVLCGLALGCLVAPAAASAQATAPKALACAVEGSSRGLRSSMLCQALGRELARPVNVIDDARQVERGDAVHLIAGDVQWTVVWLSDGHVVAWTRVSNIEAADDQRRFLMRAVSAIAKVRPEPQKECVRLDPSNSRKLSSADLAYPWAELRPCRRQLVEVPDPWWLPERI